MKLENVKKEVQPVLTEHDVKKADLFGSLARGDSDQESDIDILIEFNNKEEKTLLDLASLKNDLEEKLGKEVDVVTYDSLNSLIKDKVLEERKSIL